MFLRGFDLWLYLKFFAFLLLAHHTVIAGSFWLAFYTFVFTCAHSKRQRTVAFLYLFHIRTDPIPADSVLVHLWFQLALYMSENLPNVHGSDCGSELILVELVVDVSDVK